MPEYALLYFHRDAKPPASPEEGAAGMAKFQEWLGGLGPAVVNPGTPFGQSKVVSSDSVAEVDVANRLTGFSTVTAENIDDAIEMARSCPFLDMGVVEVAEVMSMG